MSSLAALSAKAFKACAEGNLPELKKCVEENNDILTKEADGLNLIHAGAGHLEIVKYLVSKGTKLSIMCKKYNWSVLNFALEKRNFLVVNFFVLKYLDKIQLFENKSTRDEGYTPLQYAVMYNFMNAVELLIEIGADMNLVTKNKETLIHIAVKQPTTVDNSGLIKYLCQVYGNGSIYIKLRDDLAAPLYYAVRSDVFERVKVLVQAGANVEFVGGKYMRSALHLALESRREGTYAIASCLIKKGTDLNQMYQNDQGTFYYPLTLAVLTKDIKLVELLLKNGAKVDIKSKDIAKTSGLEDIAKLLTAYHLKPVKANIVSCPSKQTIIDSFVPKNANKKPAPAFVTTNVKTNVGPSSPAAQQPEDMEGLVTTIREISFQVNNRSSSTATNLVASMLLPIVTYICTMSLFHDKPYESKPYELVRPEDSLPFVYSSQINLESFLEELNMRAANIMSEKHLKGSHVLAHALIAHRFLSLNCPRNTPLFLCHTDDDTSIYMLTLTAEFKVISLVEQQVMAQETPLEVEVPKRKAFRFSCIKSSFKKEQFVCDADTEFDFESCMKPVEKRFFASYTIDSSFIYKNTLCGFLSKDAKWFAKRSYDGKSMNLSKTWAGASVAEANIIGLLFFKKWLTLRQDKKCSARQHKKGLVLYRGNSGAFDSSGITIASRVGDIICTNAFWSTSISCAAAREFAKTQMFIIKVPPSEVPKLMYIRQVSNFYEEYEVLLPIGSLLKVDLVTKEEGLQLLNLFI